MKYTTVIWDMDGTILDTLEDLRDSVNYMLRSASYPERTLEETRCSVGNGVGNLIERSLPGGKSNPRFEELLDLFKAHYKKNCRNKTRPYEGIAAVLDALKAKGIKMAVVSNKLDTAVKELVKDFFPQLDYSLGEIEGIARKPAPDMVEKALEALGSKKCETVYIGDSEVDIMTSKNSGLDCISVLWGFRKKEELLPYGTAVFAETPDRLIELICEDQGE